MTAHPSRRRLPLTAIFAVPAALLLYLFTWPTGIEPVVWEPPPAGTWESHQPLENPVRHQLTEDHGPEDVHIANDGTVYVGTHEGHIWRYDGTHTIVAETRGRPLGLHGLSDGRLLVADAAKGLLAIDTDTGTVQVLTTTCGGAPLVFTDDVDVAPDGTVWFSDASQRFGQPVWKNDIVENGTTGRLCFWSPGDTDATEFVGGLAFANGVAIDPSGDFLLINETSRYRVRRVWIRGPNAGTHEVIIDGLPGFPDGISTGTDVFWIAIASPRSGIIDATAGQPWLRQVMMRLPSAVQPAPIRSARTIGIDGDGNVLYDLYDPDGATITTVTSVQEYGGQLYLGSLVDNAWAVIDVPRP